MHNGTRGTGRIGKGFRPVYQRLPAKRGEYTEYQKLYHKLWRQHVPPVNPAYHLGLNLWLTEERLLKAALEATNWNKSAAADLLGIRAGHLQLHLRKHNLHLHPAMGHQNKRDRKGLFTKLLPTSKGWGTAKVPPRS